MNNKNSVVLVTGASSGFGKACATYLAQQGYCVYGTCRDISSAAKLNFKMITMDVSDDNSVKQGIELILSHEDRIDIVLNNAGYGTVGAIEDTSLEEMQNQFQTNFFGIARVCRTVLPIMRKQQGGYIINMSSIGGLISVPFQGIYCASKFAIEGFTEALRIEVMPYGIRVVLIEPGDFHTGFTAHRHSAIAADKNSVYHERYRRALTVMESDEANGPPPDVVAELLYKIINTNNPRLRYSTGALMQRALALLKPFLPSSVFERIVVDYYKIK